MRRDPICHILKTEAQHFDAVVSGEKTFEMRKDDRGFETGDYLLLMRISPEVKTFRRTRRERKNAKSALVRVTHILRGEYVLEGYAALSIKLMHHDLDTVP